MKKNIKYIAVGLAVGAIGISSAAITWPAAPSGEPNGGLFMTYIQKMLVDSNVSTTDGKVKKALDADTLGSGTVTVSGSYVGIGNSNPQAKLDINGKIKTSDLQITGGASSGYILTSDGSGNATWQANNYRLKVRELNKGNAVGGGIKCLTMMDDTVKCWGYNAHGQVGIGTQTATRTLPSSLYLTGVSSVYNAGWFMVALMKDNTVYSWGYNRYGNLGVGDASHRYIPTKINTLSNVTEISLGAPYTSDRPFVCAKIGTGATSTAKCWGYNGYGQLGDGTSVAKNIPTDVVGLTNIKYIRGVGVGSGGHTCALLNDGTVKCWGYNNRGQLGVGDTTTRTVPTVVPGISDVRDLYIGDNRTCVILNDNVTLKCWGYNNYNQLCDGSATQRNSPVTISTGGGNLKEIYMSDYNYFSTRLLYSDGTVKSCGYNGYGQLGTGNTTQLSGLTAITGLTGVTKLASKGTGSYGATCALLSTGRVKCWGYNGYGQLGNGNTTTLYSPQDVLGITNAVDIYAIGHSNIYRFYVLLSDGTVKAWGNNDNGELGQGNTLWYSTPQTVKNLNTD